MPIWCKLDPDKPAIKVQSMTVRFGDGRVETTTNGFMTIGPDVVLPQLAILPRSFSLDVSAGNDRADNHIDGGEPP